MKKSTIIIAGLFWLACNNKKETAVIFSDLRAENINGDVLSFVETPFKADSAGQTGELDSCCIFIAEYDENGNTIKQINRNETGKFEAVSTRHENGLWESEKMTKNGKSYGYIETQIDDKGQYVGRKAFDTAGKLAFYYTGLTQNEYGQVLTWKRWDKDSVFRMEGESKYDKNLFIERTDKDSTGKIKLTSFAKYNDKGEQIEITKTIVGKDSTVTKFTKYTYDAHDEMGNWTHRTTWNDKGMATKMVMRKFTYRNKEAKK